MKNKYFNKDNLIKVLGAISLFFIYETYDGVKNIENKMLEHETRITVLEYAKNIEGKNEK